MASAEGSAAVSEASSQAISQSKGTGVALVTGANKGIGKEIATGLVKSGRYELVILGCRDAERGQQAADELQNGESCGVHSVVLDISEHDSIAKTATYVAEHHNGRLDLLVNNAGLAYKGKTWGADEAQATLAVNFRGTKHMTEALLPALRAAKGIVINVASSSGHLSQVSKSIQTTLLDSDLTQDRLEELANDFVAGVRDGTHAERGWSGSMYGVSKLLEIASTRLHAQQEADKGVAVYCMCPGYCVTDMTSGRGNKTAAQGAETALFLAAGGGMRGKLPTGGFYADCKQKRW